MLQLSQRPLTSSTLDAQLFVGRDEEQATILRALTLGFNVYVAGEAGSGKTSLLRMLDAELGQRSVFVGAQAAVDLTKRLRDLDTTSPGPRPPGEASISLGVDRILSHVNDIGSLEQTRERLVVLLDADDEELRRELFGPRRDELWELPLQWVVTGRTPLSAPADAFFEAVVDLGRLDAGAISALIRLRGADAEPSERKQLDLLANTVPEILGQATPRQVLALVRAAMLSPDFDETIASFEQQQAARVDVSPTAARVLDALAVIGPTYAGDERLLTEIGTSRSRIVQVLRELEATGLVVAERAGKRMLYRPAVGSIVIETGARP